MLIFGLFSKIKHLPGASAMVVIGAFILSFFSAPIVFKNKQEKWISYSRSREEAFWLSIADLIGKAGIILGVLFTFMLWPYHNIIMYSGFLIFVLTTLVWNKQFHAEIASRKEIEEQLSKTLKTISSQKDKIELINTEINQSIDYAKKIQTSVLPDAGNLSDKIIESFVLFKPKDKVSGDFYWWTQVENHTIIAAADCTGHGVPGAFMSMLGISFLREIVNKEYITHTGVILRKLRKEIIKTLNQKGEENEQKDGMDIALVSIDHEERIIQFSGANNPLYLIRNGELIEYKGDKMPIAIYERMDPFKFEEIKLIEGDRFYLFSDGFADQFGGEKGKKYMYKRFKSLLLEIAHFSMEDQKKELDRNFNEWKGQNDQVDDVIVLGFKV